MAGNEWKTCFEYVMGKYDYILAKHEDNGAMPLARHLLDVAAVAVNLAHNLGLDEAVAKKGALLHDIGKASPLFQQSLKHDYIRPPGFIFRHEIASLFFISLLEDNEQNAVIEMIAAHHKSVYQDVSGFGLLDLDENEDCFAIHAKGFDEWSKTALGILEELGFIIHSISITEAKTNYKYAVEYCESLGLNCSRWKGLLMAADHFASALDDKTENQLGKLFINPDLSFYNRISDLYPLSKIKTDDIRKHTI